MLTLAAQQQSKAAKPINQATNVMQLLPAMPMQESFFNDKRQLECVNRSRWALLEFKSKSLKQPRRIAIYILAARKEKRAYAARIHTSHACNMSLFLAEEEGDILKSNKKHAAIGHKGC